MALLLFYYSSFFRSIKHLSPEQNEIIHRIVAALEAYYQSNCNLAEAQKLEAGFFYKQLRKPYYEAGIEGKVRIIIERDQSNCFMVLAGDHNQVKQFLKKH